MSFPNISLDRAIADAKANNPTVSSWPQMPSIAELREEHNKQKVYREASDTTHEALEPSVHLQTPEPAEMPSEKPQGRVTRRGKRVPPITSDNKPSSSETAYLRDFPKNIADFAKIMFPTAKSQGKAITAYIYVTSGKAFDVDDEIKELAKTWPEEKSIESLEERLIRIEQQTRELIKLSDEMFNTTIFMLFDRLGFRRNNPRKFSEIDFSEPGMDDFTEAIKRQATMVRKRQTIKDGRSIR